MPVIMGALVTALGPFLDLSDQPSHLVGKSSRIRHCGDKKTEGLLAHVVVVRLISGDRGE